jgi:23S rRNA pseudouridine2605 synthase
MRGRSNDNFRKFEKKKPDSKPFEKFDKKPSFAKKKQDNIIKPAKGKGPKHPEVGEPSDSMRLNKYIANSGVCSRREADEIIAQGKITVNGKVVTELGLKVKKTDKVEFEGKKLNPEVKVYILLNKPKDVVTTSNDPEGRRTVMDIIAEACDERVYPVGRLDKNTTGVLLLTNDGDLSKKLTHPSTDSRKIYHVFTNKPVSKAHLEQIAKGVTLEDGVIIPDDVNYASTTDKSEVGIEIHSGKNRIVRRIFELLGYEVIKLDRVYFSGLTKKNLPRGKWRFLSPKEITMLKAGMFK